MINISDMVSNLDSGALERSAEAKAALRGLSREQVEELVALAQMEFERNKRRRVQLCAALIFSLAVLYPVSHLMSVSSIPFVIRILSTLLLGLYGAAMLLSFGGLSGRFHRVIEALTYVESDCPEVVEWLIRGLSFDWPQSKNRIAAAIGRLLPELGEAEAAVVQRAVFNRNLWTSCRNALLAANLTEEEALHIGRLLSALMPYAPSDQIKSTKLILRRIKKTGRSSGSLLLMKITNEALEQKNQ